MTDEWGIPIDEEVDYSYTKPKEPSMFEVMNACINKKMKPTLKQKQKISEFSFHALLARYENSLDLALMFNTKNIPVEVQWDMVNYLSPKGYVAFQARPEKEELIIENISKYYRCNYNIAKQYLDLMSKEDIKIMNQKYEKGKI